MKLARRHVTASGMTVLHEQSAALPIVDLELCLRSGAAWDPEGDEGLTRLAWRTWKMGTKDLANKEVDQAIAALGARMSVEVSSSLVRLRATVISRKAPEFFELLGHLLKDPAFRAIDVAQAKRESVAELVSLRDSDRAIVGRAFREHLFGTHAYGRSAAGSQKSLRKAKREAMREHWHRHALASNCVLGISGDLSFKDASRLVEDSFSALPKGRAPKLKLSSPSQEQGRRVLLVHREGRPQSHMLIGTLGSRIRDKDYDALSVANVAFGGTMASPLWQEVRETRGWSYGVSSRLGADRQREAWRMHTVPETKNAANCAALQLALMDRLVTDGVSVDEHRLAKQNLVHSQCFEWDTAPKRLEHQIDAEALPFPIEQVAKSRQRIRAVTREASNASVKKRLSNKNLSIVVLGDAKALKPEFSKLPGVDEVKTIRYDKVF